MRVTERKVKKALNDAADLIEKDGWVQGMNEINGRHCALGAVQAVVPKRKEELRGGVRRRLGDFVPPYYGGSIVSYNDTRGRTAQEVVAVFREAAQ